MQPVMARTMTDAELIDLFLKGERRWIGVLNRLRTSHERALGKSLTPLRWLPERGRGNLGWLGYYWATPPFWFGYGRRGPHWLPLIECDIRRCDPEFVLQLEANLPSSWRRLDRLAGRYWRLWAPANLTEVDGQFDWLSGRSHELHEFTVTS